MKATDPVALRYHYRVDRLIGNSWEAIDERRLVILGPLTRDEAIALLQDVAARYPGKRWRLVEDVVHSAVRAEMGEAPAGVQVVPPAPALGPLNAAAKE